MADLVISISDYAFFNQEVHVCLESFTDFYGSLKDADLYFCNRLNSKVWEQAEENDKKKALIEATRLIDRLNFKGSKADLTQWLQFPRGTDTLVPQDIKIACYEIGYRLLDDIDIEMEIDNLSVTSEGFSSVRTSFDRSPGSIHMRHGIPSAKAWFYLFPYLIDPRQITLNRKS